MSEIFKKMDQEKLEALLDAISYMNRLKPGEVPLFTMQDYDYWEQEKEKAGDKQWKEGFWTGIACAVFFVLLLMLILSYFNLIK